MTRRPPAQRPLLAPSAASSAPARTGSAKPATDRQKAALRAAAGRAQGASGDVAQEQALIETMHVAGGFAAVTSEGSEHGDRCAQQDAGR